jgi:hypothetical protein
MNPIRFCVTVVLLTGSLMLTSAAYSQQRRAPARTQPRATASPTPAPTFDTLLAADSYKLYGEVRGVGQLIHSNAINEILEPIMKLGGPPKEFKTLIKWLNTHADDVMTSRMFIATWPSASEVPETLVAIEFPSVEEAAKFEPQLNTFLPKLIPPMPVQPLPEGEQEQAKPLTPPKPIETKPGFYIKQVGALVLITPSPVNLKKVRPAGSKPLSDDAHFKQARNRFASEPLFVFIDMRTIQAEQDQRRSSLIEEKDAVAVMAPPVVEPVKEPAVPIEPDMPEELDNPTVIGVVQESPTESELSGAMSQLMNSLYQGQAKWPEAIGIAISLENDSVDARALFINAPGEKSDAIPIFPMLIPGAPIAPESPSILPADTELFVIASLDFAQIHSSLAKTPPRNEYRESRGNVQIAKETVPESTIAAVEKQLKINIKDDLLPLLGSEVALSFPVTELGMGTTAGATEATPAASPDASPEAVKPPKKGPVLALSLRDKDGMKRLLPRIIDSLGMKGASALAQTERRDDTELVSYAGAFAYAFVGNFLVLASEVESVRQVVDHYLKHETLSSDPQFKEFTRWQPRQLQGLVYVSPALMKSYTAAAALMGSTIGDPTRDFISRLGLTPKPVSYSLTNDGQGPFHELHVPKDLLLMLVAGVSGATNPPEDVQNERNAMYTMIRIEQAQSSLRRNTERAMRAWTNSLRNHLI